MVNGVIPDMNLVDLEVFITLNSLGQTLARKFLCLSDLLALLKSALPHSEDFGGTESWFEDVGSTCLELWSSVTSALCICMNNPQNDENQRLCGLELPFMFSVMLQYTQPAVINPLLSLVGFIVANNEKNQERVRRCGGLQVLCTWLHKTLQTDTHTSYQLAVHIINTIDSCITDNAESAVEVSKMSLMSDMIKVLNTDMDTDNKLKVIVSIGHTIELSEKNKDDLVKELGGLECLIQQLTLSEDEEFCRAVKYVLQLCVQKETCEKEEKDKSEAVDSRREEGMMILKKINEMSDRLRNIEEEASHNYKVINDMMSPWHPLGPAVKYSMDKDTCNREPSIKNCVAKDTRGYNHDVMHSQGDANNFDKNNKFSMLCTDEYARQSLDSIIDNNYSCQGYANILGATPAQDIDHYGKSHPAPIYSGTYMDTTAPLPHNAALLPQSQPPANMGVSTDYEVCQDVPDGPWAQEGNERMELIKRHYFKTPVNQRMSFRGDATPTCPVKDKCRNVTSYCKSPHGFTPGQQIADVQSKKELFPSSSPYCRELMSSEKAVCKKCVDSQHTPDGSCDHSLSRGQKMVVLSQGKNPDPQKTTQQLTTDNYVQNVLCSCEKSSVDITPQQCMDIHHVKKKQCVSDVSPKQTPQQQQNTPQDCQSLHPKSAGALKRQDKCKKMSNDHPKKDTETSDVDQNKETNLASISTPNCARNTKSFPEFKKPTKAAPKVRRGGSTPVRPATPIDHAPRVRRGSSVRQATPLWSVATQCRGFDVYRDPDLSDTCSEVASEFDIGLISAAGHRIATPRGRVKKIKPSHTSSTRRNGLNDLTNLSISNRVTPIQNGHRKRANKRSGIMSNRDKENGDSTDKEGMMEREKLNDNQSCHTDSSEAMSDRASTTSDNSCRLDDHRKGTCIGCSGGAMLGDTRLNSRTLNILLETSPYTCRLHRELRQLERNYISKLRKQRKQGTHGKSYLRTPQDKVVCSTPAKENTHPGVYDFQSDSDRIDVSPPRTVLKKHKVTRKSIVSVSRKERVPYTEEEVYNLQEGVKRLGKFWSQILATYRFHPSRIGVHLKDKYKQIQRQNKEYQGSHTSRSQPHKPFSMCEERRLLKGVKAFGYNWKSILQSYKFAEGRTNEDLRSKWRSMNRNSHTQNS